MLITIKLDVASLKAPSIPRTLDKGDEKRRKEEERKWRLRCWLNEEGEDGPWNPLSVARE